MLVINNIHAGYEGAEVLHGVSLEVSAGETVALLGANGAGKTTLLMTISGLVSLSYGDIRIDNTSIKSLSPEAVIRKGVAHVPEGRRIFPELTVAENLQLGARLVRERKLAREGVEQVLDLFPVLRERYKSLGGVLSGGEQQMLAIARGLVSKPRLLLIDEPSLGLAPVAVEQVFELLSQVAQGGTSLLLVEQNAELAFGLTKRVYVMESGCIVLSGTAEELVKDHRLADAYLGTTQW